MAGAVLPGENVKDNHRVWNKQFVMVPFPPAMTITHDVNIPSKKPAAPLKATASGHNRPGLHD
jgi:hypothetical protein